MEKSALLFSGEGGVGKKVLKTCRISLMGSDILNAERNGRGAQPG